MIKGGPLPSDTPPIRLLHYPMKRFSLPILVACTVLLSLTGCNVFEGFYEAGTSNDPAVLMSDASQAMQQGEPEKAVAILEKAVEKTQPKTIARSEVQINLATAKMAAANVSVIQLQRVIEDLNDLVDNGGAGSGKGFGFAAEVCSYSPFDQRLEQLHLDEIDGYTEISGKQEVLDEVQRLVNEALNFTGSAESQFDIQTRIDSLQQAGLSQSHISEALLNSALAYVGDAYGNIVDAGGEQINWYRVQANAGDYYVGYCAPSQQVVDEVKDETACSMSDIQFSVNLLRSRAAFFDAGSLAHEIADKAQEGYEKLEEELDGTCTP